MAGNDSEHQIRDIVAARSSAVRLGDIDAMMADVADDVVTFDVVDPLRRTGTDTARQRASEWLASYDGPIHWEDRDLAISVDGGVAFCHCLSRVQGRLKTGVLVDMYFRKTLGFRQIDGRWLVVHDHGSVPFDPVTGKASLGLKPDR